MLTPQAVGKLFVVLKKLASEGCSILYISHKLHEIRELCNACTVLRGGKVTGVCNPAQESNASLSRMMIGAEPPQLTHRALQAGAPVLRVQNLQLAREDQFGVDLHGITLTVHAGEVAASMSPLKGTLTCARCHRTAGRLIGAMICVSCKNREYEFLKGKNAKGTAPVKLCALNARRLRYRHGDEILSVRGRHTVDADELLVAVLRDSKQSVVFAFNSTPPAAVRQARLW